MMGRTIDLASGGVHLAHSQRRVDATDAELEAGWRIPFAGAFVVPAVHAGIATIGSDAFIESGDTGFELAIDRHQLRQTRVGADVHVLRDWHVGRHLFQFDLAGGYTQSAGSGDTPWMAAFTGAPGLRFALPGTTRIRGGWMTVGLRGQAAHGWQWSLGHQRPMASSPSWTAGLQRAF